MTVALERVTRLIDGIPAIVDDLRLNLPAAREFFAAGSEPP